jgi:ribonucleoside-diphosphate reductase alpha chain
MVNKIFYKIKDINDVALNILRKRYFNKDESSWEELVDRVVNYILPEDNDNKLLTKDLIENLYFIPNSPCLVNAGKKDGGLFACYVLDFPDNIEGIYKTKLDFALIARKGGGCGTTLSKLRPKNSIVSGSTHGYAGGPVDFYNTICSDMEVMSQAGFRNMAMMGAMSIYHPDILRFLFAKYHENKMTTTNLSIVIDNLFMKTLEENPNEPHIVYHDSWGKGYLFLNDENNKYYPEEWYEDLPKDKSILTVEQLFNFIVDSSWRNGEPGILFYEKMNNSPYNITGQELVTTNPCSEQALPFNGCCNLGSLDISKFFYNGIFDLARLELAVRLSVRFLDSVIDRNSYPTKEIENWSFNNRPIGLGIMGFADYLLIQKIEYGSEISKELLEFVLNFIYKIAEDESILLGEEKGIPKKCKKLPVPRRNITLLTVAPTGTTSLIAGCSSSIEPIFSEVTVRNDKTGTYQFENDLINEPYFKCAVSTNGSNEVTWQEHLAILNSAQRFVDSGISKTINCPQGTKKSTIYKIFTEAWKLPYIKGLTVYRNGSREVEVLSPKNLKKDLCPYCESEMINKNGCRECINKECQFSFCEL